MSRVDVEVVGSGPNGLAAAVTLARSGLKVRVREAHSSIGGGMRTSELTQPGFSHDDCSAVHPQALVSPFFTAFELSKRVRFITPEVSYAHPIDRGRTGLAYRELALTAESLGADGKRWRSLFEPLLKDPVSLERLTMAQIGTVPIRPATAFRLATRAMEQGSPLRNLRFADDVAPAMLSGASAHIGTPQSLAGAAAGLALATTAHGGGWPIVSGGSQRIADALVSDLLAHGGIVETDSIVHSLDELEGTVSILNLSPPNFARLASARLPTAYLRMLSRFRFGPAACKVDYALSEAVPWSDPRVREAATVHLGGTRPEIEAAERLVRQGRHSGRPFVIASQPTIFDPSRAPAGKHILWAYCHVPNGSDVDVSEAITAQIERYAPGFRDTILSTSVRTGAQMAAHNPNYVGGDILAGAVDVRQLAFRPRVSLTPWSTPLPGVYLASASTSPGPAVHGMAGYSAARLALHRDFGMRELPDLSVARHLRSSPTP
ncbi:MAG: NAD(P)/FAD-dependent oxidoreductase [Leifsonia sp.]